MLFSFSLAMHTSSAGFKRQDQVPMPFH